jgi:very-short-patch-repair endonuclease
MHIPKTSELCINQFKKIHGDRYDYSKVIYITSKIKVCIICNLHGEFWQTPDDHLHNRNCPSCKKTIISNTKKSSLEEFLNNAQLVHEFKYDYSKFVYTKSQIKSIVTCPIHGDWLQSPNNHLRGRGCPKCKSSKGEQLVRHFLKQSNYKFEEQKKFKDCRNTHTNRLLFFDFYLPDHNMCIEFDGEQHFNPKSFGSDRSIETKQRNLEIIQTRDKIKDEYCISNGIHLLRISYKEMYHIDSILFNQIPKPIPT